MANDKLVDSGKLDAALTATADAIRTKTGDAAQIPFDLAGQTGFKAAVEAITGRGGLPEGIDSIYYGTYTPASDQSSVTINHNLGTLKPMVAAVWVSDRDGRTFTGYDTLFSTIFSTDDIFQRISGSGESSYGVEMYTVAAFTNSGYGDMVTTNTPSGSSYIPYAQDQNNYIFRRLSATKKFTAGLEYKVLVIKGA